MYWVNRWIINYSTFARERLHAIFSHNQDAQLNCRQTSQQPCHTYITAGLPNTYTRTRMGHRVATGAQQLASISRDWIILRFSLFLAPSLHIFTPPPPASFSLANNSTYWTLNLHDSRSGHHHLPCGFPFCILQQTPREWASCGLNQINPLKLPLTGT